ncbi:MAG: tetratricopeptide repeat protein [Pseudomonadota bacterium]|nr:tetratricopeptide repeat protein [Pseudomonadota bacterium]
MNPDTWHADGQRLKTDAVKRHMDGDPAGARQLYYQALILRPDDAEIWTNLGTAHRALKQHDAALAAQRAAFERDPGNPVVRNNLCNALDDLGFHDEAVPLRREMLEGDPGSAKKQAALARSLFQSGQVAESEAVIQAAFRTGAPGADVSLEHAMQCLTKGNYGEGFRYYLHRRNAGLISLPHTSVERWTGQDPTGKSILVLPEQGFGDTVCFSRFLPYLKERGATTHVLVRPPLQRLMQRMDGADTLLSDLRPGQPYDYWTSLMDIPVDHFHFRETIPDPVHLTLPDAALKRAAQLTSAHAGKLKVGCCWRGSEGYERNEARSMSHRDLLDMAALDGVQFFSLYKGPALDALHADGSAATILDAGGSDADLADCAAMIDAMDLVITTDTVTAHIAGSLGKPVWNLLHWEPFWLYGTDATRTPWYPTMRLYRQSRPGDWSQVLDNVKADLIARRDAAGGDTRG